MPEEIFGEIGRRCSQLQDVGPACKKSINCQADELAMLKDLEVQVSEARRRRDQRRGSMPFDGTERRLGALGKRRFCWVLRCTRID